MRKKFRLQLLLLALVPFLLFFSCIAWRAAHRGKAAENRGRIGLYPAPETISNGIANQQFFPHGAPDGGILTQALAAEPAHFNTIILNEATASEISGLCNATLGERDWTHPEEFQPMLAESWKISADHLRYDITLRKNLFYCDYRDPDTGEWVRKTAVTAHDFKFFADVIRDESVNAAPLRVYYQDLDRIEVFDDRHFSVIWKRPFYGSLSATLSMSPLPKKFYWNYPGKFDGARFNRDHRRNRMIVGCGPYRLDEWKRDQYIRLVRNENYFGAAYGIAPKIDVLYFRIIKHPNTRFQALRAKTLDALGLTPDQWVNRARDRIFTDGSFQKFRYLTPVYTYIGYNQKNPIFQERKVRQALTLLVDRKRILHDIYFDLAECVNGPFYLQSAYCDKALPPWPYDPERAKKLLDEAGWRDADGDGIREKSGRKLAFTILQVANHPTQQKMLPLLKESFAAAGIDMQIQTVEWSVYVRKLDERAFDACTLGWSGSFDPDLYQIWHSSQIEGTGSNFIGYRNAEVDRLIEEMRVTFDLPKRIEIAHKIEKILYEDQPYTFLFTPYALRTISTKFGNVRKFPVGIPEMIFYEK